MRRSSALLCLFACHSAHAFFISPTPLGAHRSLCATGRAPAAALCAEPSSPASQQLAVQQEEAPAAATVARSGPQGWWRRTVRRVVTAVAIASASLTMRRPSAMPQAYAVTAAAQKKIARPKARSNGGQSTLTTVAMMGGIGFWAYRQAALEDKEETVRIKKENEKMQRMSKEFTEVDGEVTVDADLAASLAKRLNQTKTEGSDGDGPDGGAPADPKVGEQMDGGTATLERPDASGSGSDGAPPAAEPPAPAMGDAADVERLKRMFGADDAEK